MLKLTTIKKYYNKHLVLEIQDFQIGNGIFWIKGINGSGKTTLLKMIAGLLPFEGDISFNDTSLVYKPITYRQNVTWAEAEPIYPSFVTGMDLLSFYRSIRKVSKKEVDTLIELFNIGEHLNNSVGTYSAGMTKKLSLALAFLGNQQLIILDEPFITLDTSALTLLSNFILEKNKFDGMTIILSSHQELDNRLLLPGKELIVENKTLLSFDESSK